jgi:protein disulfide-isomerase A6
LDTLASKFLAATEEIKNSIYKEAIDLAEAAGVTSKHYLRVMEKMLAGSEAYLDKELKR